MRKSGGLLSLALTVLVVPLLLACGIPGERGEIHYTPSGGIFGSQVVATGGTGIYGTDSMRVGDLLEVESLTPDVMEVISFDATSFTVRGVAAGAARVRTRTVATEDVAPLEVHDIALVSARAVHVSPGWRELLLTYGPALVPATASIAIVRGAPEVDVAFEPRDAAGSILMDTSAVLVMPVSATGADPTVSAAVRVGGTIFPVELPVVDGPDRLVRHGAAADIVWAVQPETEVCVAPLAGPHSIAGHALRAEARAPWAVEALDAPAQPAYATCFFVTFDPTVPGEPGEIVITDGTLTFVQPVEP